MDGPPDPPDPGTTSESFDRLTHRLKAGHESAFEEVVDRYDHRLQGLARKKLPASLGRKFDPEDVTQSTFRTFFDRYGQGQFDQLGDWEETWRLLAFITDRKCRRKIAEFHTQRRDVRRESPIHGQTHDSGLPLQLESSDTPASEAAIFADLVEVLLKELNPRDRRIVDLALAGHTPEEIHHIIVRSRRTVDRALHKFKLLVEQARDEDA